MVIDIFSALEAGAGIVTVAGGAYTAFKHFDHKSRQKREQYRADILKVAKEELTKVESGIETKIRKLEVELEVQKQNVSKDLGHLKEIYNAEIKVLGEKIELLRQDLSDQHSTMVNLLTKLINSK